MASLYQLRERPSRVPPAVLIPFGGGPEEAFNTRYRDVQVGVTKPNASNTGTLPGTALQRVNGNIVIPETSSGETFEGLDIYGKVLNQGLGVTTFRNCRIHIDDVPTVNTGVVANQRPGAYTVLIDCEIYSTVSTRLVNGLLGGNIRLLRCKIHDVVDFMSVYNPDNDNPAGPTNVVVEACYGYDLLYYSPDPTHIGTDNRTHNDGVQIQGGSGTIVRGSRFDMTEGPLSHVDLAAGGALSEGLIGQGVTITPVRASTHGSLIENNWFNYGIRGIIAEGADGLISATVRGNKFGPNIITDPGKFHGPIVARSGWFNGFPATSGLATSKNVYESTGAPVPVFYRGE